MGQLVTGVWLTKAQLHSSACHERHKYTFAHGGCRIQGRTIVRKQPASALFADGLRALSPSPQKTLAAVALASMACN